MKKKIIFLVVILITVSLILFLLFRHKEDEGFEYRTEEIVINDVRETVITVGTLNPRMIVDIGTQVSGRISEIFVDFNSEVKQGQIIAKIDPELANTKVRQDEANYKSAKAAFEKSKVGLANTRKSYDRTLNLFDKNLVSYEERENVEVQYLGAVADLQVAEAKLAQAESQLESSKINLNNTVVRSPINGIIIDKKVNIGQTVAASFQAPILFQVANSLDEMQVECSIDEADIGKIKKDQKVEFTVDAFLDENFYGKVIQIRYAAIIISNVVTYTAIIEVNNPEMKLLPGMTAMVTVIIAEAKDVLVVPNSALNVQMPIGPAQERPKRKQEQQFSVWIIDENGDVKQVFIEKGVTDNSNTEVAKGELKEGQLVIVGINIKTKEGARDGSSSIRDLTRILR